MNADRLWMIGSAVLTVAILAAGWFIGVNPMLTVAATSESDRVAAEQQNMALEQTLADLSARFDGLSALRAQLDEISGALPAEQNVSEFLGALSTHSAETSTTITAVTVSDALPYLPVVPDPAAVEAEAAEGETPSEDTTASADPSADVSADPGAALEPAASMELPVDTSIANVELVTAENFVATPITISAEGSLENLMSFVDRLQLGDRIYLVTKLTLSQDDETGEYSADIDGLAYSLIPSDSPIVGGDTDAPLVTLN